MHAQRETKTNSEEGFSELQRDGVQMHGPVATASATSTIRVCVCVPYVMLQLDEGVNPADGSKNDALQSPESGP